MKKFIKEYWIELIAVLIASLGIYVLIFKPRVAINVQYLISWLDGLFNHVKILVTLYLTQHILDLFSVLFVFLGIVFIIWRFRVRLLHSKHWNASVCPRCGSRLNRKHRSRLDHLLSHTLLPDARRYRCPNPDCGWTGLRSHKFPDRLKKEETKVLSDQTG